MSEKRRSAKATEAEAGQRPVPPRATQARRLFSLHSQSARDGPVYLQDTAQGVGEAEGRRVKPRGAVESGVKPPHSRSSEGEGGGGDEDDEFAF